MWTCSVLPVLPEHSTQALELAAFTILSSGMNRLYAQQTHNHLLDVQWTWLSWPAQTHHADALQLSTFCMSCTDQGRHMGGWPQQESHPVLQCDWLPSQQMGGLLCDADHHHLPLLHRHCSGHCYQHRPLLPRHPHQQAVRPFAETCTGPWLDCMKRPADLLAEPELHCSSGSNYMDTYFQELGMCHECCWHASIDNGMVTHVCPLQDMDCHLWGHLDIYHDLHSQLPPLQDLQHHILVRHRLHSAVPHHHCM